MSSAAIKKPRHVAVVEEIRRAPSEQPASPPPLMDDEKLYRSIEAIQDAKAIADSIWRMADLSGLQDVNELAETAVISRRLALGLSRILEECADDLNKIHGEWLKRCLAASANKDNAPFDLSVHAGGLDNVQ